MNDRKKFRWKVVLATEEGDVREVEFSSYWDPKFFEGDTLEIARAAQAEDFIVTRKKQGKPGMPVSAELIA